MKRVLTADHWPTNGHIVRDALVPLGYLRTGWVALDPTFGLEGGWWKLWQPRDLMTCCRPEDGSDFRDIQQPTGVIDVVAFDPPYVSQGGRETSTLGPTGMIDRFGMHDTEATPELQQAVNDAGLVEVHRVLRRGGLALVKAQQYVTSGQLFDGTYHVKQCAYELGFRLVDQLIHVGSPGPQPAHARQVHADNNASDLLVLEKR